MLNKSYQELFKNPVSLKRNIKKIIIDIDERLKLVEKGGSFVNVFALKNHNHDDKYAKIIHDHNNLYANRIHLHDSDYIRKNETAFNSERLHNYTYDHFSEKGHYHKNVMYIHSFTVPNLTEGNIEINLPFGIIKENAIVLEDIFFKWFNIDVTENIVNLSYKFTEEISKTTFHLIYWTYKNIETGELEETNTTTKNINANQGDTITLSSSTVDSDNNPVIHGDVEYNIFD